MDVPLIATMFGMWGYGRSRCPAHRRPPATPDSRILGDPSSTPVEAASVLKRLICGGHRWRHEPASRSSVPPRRQVLPRRRPPGAECPLRAG